MASENHLHSETKMLPIRDHLSMLSAQYLASASQPDHPAHEPVRRPARRRDKKKTLQSRFKDVVAPHLVNGSLPHGTYPLVKKSIHTKYVSEANNGQRQSPPPQSAYSCSQQYRTAASKTLSLHSVPIAFGTLRKFGKLSTSSRAFRFTYLSFKQQRRPNRLPPF